MQAQQSDYCAACGRGGRRLVRRPHVAAEKSGVRGAGSCRLNNAIAGGAAPEARAPVADGAALKAQAPVPRLRGAAPEALAPVA